MKLTKKQTLDLWNALSIISANDHPVRLAYAIARTRTKLQPIIEAMQETTKPLDAFEERRRELGLEFCSRKSDGEPVVLPNGEYAIADRPSYDRELEKAKKETGQDEKEKEVEELMKEEEDVRVHQITFSMLPESIRPDVLGAMLPMIRDEPEDEDEGSTADRSEPASDPE